MKFAQLTIGQRFVFKDHEYIKTSELMAESNQGQKRRLIPRSATVVPMKSPASQPEPPETIPFETLEQILELLAERINNIVSHSDLSANQRNRLSGEFHRAFVQARQSLLFQAEKPA